MQEMAEAFEAEYGVKVTVEEVDHTKTGERLAQDGPAGIGADVIAAPHDHTGNLVMSGLIVPNMFADEVRDTQIEAAVTAVSFDGEVYGFPRAIETYAMFYNKDILPTPPATYEELIEFGRTYTDVNANQYAFYMDVDNAYFVQSFLAGGGGYVFGNGGTDATDVGLDSEGAIFGIEEMMKLKEILPIPSGDADYGPMMGLFNEGKVGAIITGPWEIAALRELDLNWGVAQLPKLSNGNDSAPFSGVRSLYVSAYSEYPVAAQMFADFYISEEHQMARFDKTGQIPTFKGAADMPAIQADEAVAGIAAQAAFSQPMPSIPEIQLFWGPVGAAYGIIWNEEVTVEQGMTDAANQVRSDIANQ
jgi:arabinogalactan oligomer/maltooligosaccharide transport system substrate-binding protein